MALHFFGNLVHFCVSPLSYSVNLGFIDSVLYVLSGYTAVVVDWCGACREQIANHVVP